MSRPESNYYRKIVLIRRCAGKLLLRSVSALVSILDFAYQIGFTIDVPVPPRFNLLIL
jgi:hypothetical protein